MRSLSSALVVAAAVILVGVTSAQTQIRRWAWLTDDTEARVLPTAQIGAGWGFTAIRRVDGRIFCLGQDLGRGVCSVPDLPPGTGYVDMFVGPQAVIALRSDGQWITWGYGFLPSAGPPVVPPLPIGLTYTKFAVGAGCFVALRSDGGVIATGISGPQPTVQPGVSIADVQVDTGASIAHMLLSNGSILSWGGGVTVAPTLPAGVTYTSMCAGVLTALAMRSDGVLVAWGSNPYGTTIVPTLPQGVTFTNFTVNGSAHGLRSDGHLVSWGLQYSPQWPTAALGSPCVQLVAGDTHAVALLADGSMVTWGSLSCGAAGPDPLPVPLRYSQAADGEYYTLALIDNGTMQAWGDTAGSLLSPPAIAPGLFVTKVSGHGHPMALLSDGTIRSWGNPSYGLTTVPALPLGLHYTDVSASTLHSVAIRSDGCAVAWGWNQYGACNIASPAPGISYVSASCHYYRTDLVCSDGRVATFGYNASGTTNPPLPPIGRRYVETATSELRSAGLLSDGQIVLWGSPIAGSAVGATILPPLPFGVYYVQITAGQDHIAARRSDGQVVVCGVLQRNQGRVPPLGVGTSYLSINASTDTTTAVVGPQSTFVSLAHGCAGSLPATRLVPRDTPKIGRTFEVTLFDLPQDVALLAMGWQSINPLSLGFLGMPGCDLAIAVDAAGALTGSGQQAKWLLPIPDLPVLVGLHFFNQALVLDLAAGNALGAVLSDAAEGVVGYPR